MRRFLARLFIVRPLTCVTWLLNHIEPPLLWCIDSTLPASWGLDRKLCKWFSWAALRCLYWSIASCEGRRVAAEICFQLQFQELMKLLDEIGDNPNITDEHVKGPTCRPKTH